MEMKRGMTSIFTVVLTDEMSISHSSFSYYMVYYDMLNIVGAT